MKRALTFEQACSQYVMRFTGDHVPMWALKQRQDKSFYAPQFISDREWYDLAKFPGERGYFGTGGDCQSGPQSWPLGQALRKPFNRVAFQKLNAHQYHAAESVNVDLYGFMPIEAIANLSNIEADIIAEYTTFAVRIIRTPTASGWQDSLARLFCLADGKRKMRIIEAFGEDLRRVG